MRKKLKVGPAYMPAFASPATAWYRLCWAEGAIPAYQLLSCVVIRCPHRLSVAKVAGGADYDTGANASGYKSNAGEIRRKAMAAYGKKEKEGNITKVRCRGCLDFALVTCHVCHVCQVTYVTSALPATTPVDLSGRAMVASAAEAQRYVMLFWTAWYGWCCGGVVL